MKNKIHFPLFILIILGLSFSSCTESQQSPHLKENAKKSTAFFTKNKKSTPAIFPKNRTAILEHLQQKIEKNQPLIIHLFVPLCDNDHQGIVPVNKNLGNGLNLRTNLYWGALYGVKTHFKKQKDWKFLGSSLPSSKANQTENNLAKNLPQEVLERVVFYKKFSNDAEVYLVADAYRGDKMKACLNDYFGALSGKEKNTVQVSDQLIPIYGDADLIVFNGHNGLMDTTVPVIQKSHSTSKDAIAIACISFDYFEKYYQVANAYPVLTTQKLLAPEAYVLENVFDAWSLLKSETEIHHAAGSAYHQYQKCGIKGAKRLFKTGW